MKSHSKKLSADEKQRHIALIELVREYPALENKIYQHLIILLHSRGILSIDQIYDETLETPNTVARYGEDYDDFDAASMSNMYIPSRWSSDERQAIHALAANVVAQNFSEREITDIISLVVRREEVKNLEDIARLPDISFDLLAKKVREFCELPETSMSLPLSDIMATRVSLIHHFISDQIDVVGIAKKYIRIRDLDIIAQYTIGPRRGIGRIGGKAAGMILANRILDQTIRDDEKKLEFKVKIPKHSYYLRSDLYFEFVKENGLFHYYNQKYKEIDLVSKEYDVIREIFKNGVFPDYIVDELKALFQKLGPVPLIVRSSSLLEDNFGAAFSGKYRSIYLPNQGDEATRFRDLLGAITEVYSSILHPDPISYRQKKNLVDYDEMMGILIQKVIGHQYGSYFFPLFSGVAFSSNEYRWTPRIRKEDGMLRMVMGLGTRAVDRVSSDYPRIVALTAPTLRPQGSVDDIYKYSQRRLDVINITENRFETIRLNDLPFEKPIPYLDRIVSSYEEGSLLPMIGQYVTSDPKKLVITFDRLIANTSFPAQMKWMLANLEQAYGCPVDIEYTFDGKALYLLQCRPLSKRIELNKMPLPHNIQESEVVFSADRDVQTGFIEDIEYVIYIPAAAYYAISSLQQKQAVGRIVGALNKKLSDRRFILMGPGRWGSSDINLGVRVFYNDINNTCALIEVAEESQGYAPELSYGTHFFQDLMESNIYYLPLYVDQKGYRFNRDILHHTPNALGTLFPQFAEFDQQIRVINMRTLFPGKQMNMDMDSDTNQALACLVDQEKD